MAGTQILDRDVVRELREVLGDDFHLLVTTFLADSEHRLQALRAAIDAGDALALRETAHSFKGSSLNIGAVRLGEACRQLEALALDGVPADARARVDGLAGDYRQVAAALAAHLPGAR